VTRRRRRRRIIMIKVKNLFAPLGICQIVGLVLGILVLILGIVSRPYTSVRTYTDRGIGWVSSNETEFDKFDFSFGHDLFFIGFFVPLLLSILSIVLTLMDSKEKIAGAGIHALIGLFCFLISVYLLYSVVTVHNNECKVYDKPLPNSRKTATALEMEEDYLTNKTKECNEKYPYPTAIPPDRAARWKVQGDRCYCKAKVNYKFELCIAAGAFGFIYALLNIGSAVLAFLAKRD